MTWDNAVQLLESCLTIRLSVIRLCEMQRAADLRFRFRSDKDLGLSYHITGALSLKGFPCLSSFKQVPSSECMDAGLRI